MIRTSQHILKFSNLNKLNYLNQLYSDYKIDLQFYINLILSNNLSLKRNLSSKLLPNNKIKHSQWKQIIYKQASEIVRSQIKRAYNRRYKVYKKLYAKCKENNRHQSFTSKRFKELNLKYIIYTKYFTIPNIQNISINVDSRLINSNFNSQFFNEYIQIKLPYFRNKWKAITINLPIKYHKHSLKYNSWRRKNTIQLKKMNDNFYIKFFYEKEQPIKKKIKTSIGIDVGYKKLISTSTNNNYGIELQKVYEKLNGQLQGSHNFKQILVERNKLVNQYCNELNKNEQFEQLIVEDLKKIKRNSKKNKSINTKFMNKLQRWSYPRVINKLERLSEEEGFSLIKVNPAYTSQTCSNCGSINKKSRIGEDFKCIDCGYKIDADYNAAINILHRGDYNPSINQSSFY